MLSVLWLAFESLVRIFRDRRDLIFEKFVLRQQLPVVRTDVLTEIHDKPPKHRADGGRHVLAPLSL